MSFGSFWNGSASRPEGRNETRGLGAKRSGWLWPKAPLRYLLMPGCPYLKNAD